MSDSALAVSHHQQPIVNPTVIVASPILEVASLLERQRRAGALVGYDHVFDSSDWPLPEYCRERGFHRWCSGEDRIVLFHDSGWCLKASLSPGYESANRRELSKLAELAPADRLLFAETHSLPGDILLQREYRVDPARFAQFETKSKEILQAQWRLRIMDIHEYNVGWRADGGWVFIDWAGAPRQR